jgi:ketosteroid isomerase-like protein
MSKPAELARAFYAAVSRGDVPEVIGLLRPDLHWTEAEGFPYYSGTWRTPQEVVDKLLVPLMRDWDNFSVSSVRTRAVAPVPTASHFASGLPAPRPSTNGSAIRLMATDNRDRRGSYG